MSRAERDEVRADIYKIITAESSVKCIACVCSTEAAYNLSNVSEQDDLYHGTYKPVTERFQYYLQDLSKTVGRKEFGIVVSDHRGKRDDKRLRSHHQKLLYSTAEYISRYENLIEGLFLEPSNLSVGIQLADMFAGAVWRKFERGDSQWYDRVAPSIRCNARGEVDGYGIVKFPTKGWI